LRQRYEDHGVHIHPLNIRNLYGSGTWRELVRFADLIRRERIEVLHTHDVYCNIFGAPAGRLARVRGILCSRRWWKRVPRAGLLIPNRVAYGLAHRVLANSRAVATMLEREERVPARKISTIPNFVEDDAFDVPDRDVMTAWRTAHGVPLDALLFGVVGRLAPVKDNATLIRALAMVEPSFRAHVVLVGDGPERAMLVELARQLGLANRVHFTGLQANRPNPHQFFDISVLCSLSEGFPNSMLEAMAAGRPTIATPVGGITDALKDGVNGLLFPAGDAAALASRMEQLAGSPPLREELGEAGRTVARADYAAGPVLERLTTLYESLARRHATA
jgi:glycosyltransferase involved in cell wall biosynthesis